MTKPYSVEELSRFVREYADTEWMVHVAGPDERLTHRDEFEVEPLTERNARDLAAAINGLAVGRPDAHGTAPEMRACVFHYGVPLDDAPVAS